MSIILAIESSCDETSAAVIHDGKILANIVATQEVHKEYGGVVPELASRAHQQNIIPVVNQALQKANIQKEQLNAVAFTRGPGLMGALLVGTSFSKAIALSLSIPLIEINHMEAHILAHFIDDPKPEFPFLCLTISGGHTQIVRVDSPLEMYVIGKTIDDAVGEAFDKTAKILGIEYPGGPLIDKLSQTGDPLRFDFAQSNLIGYNFSFSGIKTSILYFLQKEMAQNPNFISENLADLCASIQRNLVEMLMKKFKQAAIDTGIKHLGIAGGVAANSLVRKELAKLAEKHNWHAYIPKFEYCTDNAAMIAMAAHYKYLAQNFSTQTISAEPRMKINDL
jgi:N6-L-threonylcarbamoyladenine synthase